MIQISNLVKKYDNKTALQGVNLTVKEGEILGLLGPNGAGKSTTMNILTGYISATSGTVKINGEDILTNPIKAKRSIGYLPEIPPLYMDMKVKEYLDFVAKLKKVKKSERKEEIRRVIDITEIGEYENRLIKYLSKGYKQRVGLAQALLGNPKVLILDEPTVGMDPKQIMNIRELIKSLAKEHTIIISSHILSEISAVCDSVVIMNHGKIIAELDMEQETESLEELFLQLTEEEGGEEE